MLCSKLFQAELKVHFTSKRWKVDDQLMERNVGFCAKDVQSF